MHLEDLKTRQVKFKILLPLWKIVEIEIEVSIFTEIMRDKETETKLEMKEDRDFKDHMLIEE